MQIENGDALKAWLMKSLTTVSDADPQSLSRYVLALLKKDKTETELRVFCVEQLDVFLGKATKKFVDQVFAIVRDKSYLPGAKPSTAATDDTTAAPKSSASKPSKVERKEEKKPEKHHRSSRETGVKEDKKSASSSAAAAPTRSSARIASTVRDTTKRSPPASSSKEPMRKRIGAPASTVERNGRGDDARKRSRSRERTTITVSTANVHNRLGPPVRTVRTGPPTDDRRDARRGRSRSPEKTRSRSRSPRASRHVRRIVRQHIDDLSSGSASSDDDDVPTKRTRKQRCKDYDEKGFCMLGDACPFDHGPDPVVVDPRSALPAHLPDMMSKPPPPSIPNMAVPPPGILPPGVEGPPGVAPIVPQQQQPLSQVQQPQAQLQQQHAVPVILMQPGGGFTNFGYGQMANLQQPPPSVHPQFMQPPPQLQYGVDGGIRSRIGCVPRFRAPRPSPDSKTLVISKVPPHQNNIGSLDSHFKQFGPVTNIKVCFGGRHDQALVTYADRYNALQAFKSTQPILNNRFIRCFWYDGAADGAAGDEMDGGGVAETVRVTSQGGISKTLYNRGAMRKRTAGPTPAHETGGHDPNYQTSAAAQQEYVAQRKARKDNQAKRQMIVDLQKQKHKLLSATLQEQKVVIEKLASTTNLKLGIELRKIFKVYDERAKTIRTEIDELQEKAKKLGESKDAAAENTHEWRRQRAADVRAEQVQLKERIRRASLSKSDTSIASDGVAKMEMGDDADKTESKELMARMAQLKRELVTLNRSKGAMRGGRGGGTPSKRGGRRGAVPPSIQQLDKRPTVVQISDFKANEKDDLMTHLQQFGTVASCDFDTKDGKLRAMAKYNSRKAAEQAVELAGDFKERSISVGWASMRTTRTSLSDMAIGGKRTDADDVGRRLSASQMLAKISQDDDMSDGGDALVDDAILDDDEEENGATGGRQIEIKEEDAHL